MIDPTLSAIIGVAVGGAISFTTTYIMNERRYKHERIAEGIEFYRSMLKEILPLLKNVAQLREALTSLKTAKEKEIHGEKGFPTLYVDLDKGPRYLGNSALHTLIDKQLLGKLVTLTRSPWMTIAPGNVSISALMLTGIVADLTENYWNAPPIKIINLVDEIWKVLEDLDISVLKMLGLLPAYRAIHKTKPGFASEKLRKLMERKFKKK